MDPEERVRLVERLADGETSLRELAGISRSDIDAVAHLGRLAFEARKYRRAVRIFAGLEALDPDRPAHGLARAHAEAADGERAEALATVTRYIDSELFRPKDELVDALLLRAALRRDEDAAGAARDVGAAQLLGGRLADPAETEQTP